MIKNQLSIASYSFHKLFEEKVIDIFGYIESVRYRYNLDGADIWNGYLRETDRDGFKKIRRELDRRGLKLTSLCCDWAQPWCADNDYGKQCDANAEKFLDAAEILGAQTVRIDVGVPEENINEEQFQTVCEKFLRYAKRGAEAGFMFGPENHWGASRKLSLQQRLYKEINHPSYGILLHLGNWLLEDGQTLYGNDLAAVPMTAHTHVDYGYALAADEWLADILNAGYAGALSVEHHKALSEYEGVAAQLGALVYSIKKYELGV